MSFLKRGLISAAIIAAATFAVQPDQSPAPAPASAAASATPANYDEAEVMVDSALWQVMGTDATSCWERPEDRWGRVPNSAVVKRDGTTEVYQTSTNIKPDEWVLAWCAVPVTDKEIH